MFAVVQTEAGKVNAVHVLPSRESAIEYARRLMARTYTPLSVIGLEQAADEIRRHGWFHLDFGFTTSVVPVSEIT